ncbi:MAG: hypothetical protein ABW321_12425 [Polyangiales bacterium]
MQAQDTTTPLKPTRASFIRSLPETMPVEEVIERGREAGLVIQPSDIHAARYYMRQGAGAPPTGKPGLAPDLVSTVHGKHGGPGGKDQKSSLTVTAPGVYVVTGRPAETTTVTVPARDGSTLLAKARGAQVNQVPVDTKEAKLEKLRAKRPIDPPEVVEEQLRLLVLRVGTLRTRAIIDQLEASAPLMK